MKFAVLSESPADEAAIRILTNGILGEETEPVALNKFRTRRGFSTVLKNLSAVLMHLYYETDADGLAVVLDSDRTPIHRQSHAEPDNADPDCRLCTLRKKVAEVQSRVAEMPGRSRFNVAIGLAVPQIEAWLLCGKNRQIGEARWLMGVQETKPPFTSRSLKIEVYGSDRCNLEHETACMVRESKRVVAEKLKELEETWFPEGFGSFAQDVRGWKPKP